MVPTRCAPGVAVLLSAALACGCGHLRRGEREPYSCVSQARGRQPPAVIEARATPGRLSVAVLPASRPLPDEPAQTAWQRLDATRLEIVAEAIPAHLFAARLAEALHLPVVTDPKIANVPISITAEAITFLDLESALGDTHNLSFRLESQRSHDQPTLYLVSLETEWQLHDTVRARPLGEQIIATGAERAREIASALCGHVLTPAGRVAVVGNRLFVSDLADNFTRIRTAVGQLDVDVPERPPR